MLRADTKRTTPNDHSLTASQQAALSAAREGRWQEAITLLQQELAQDPSWIEGRIALGVCLANLGQTSEAEAQLLSAVRQAPVDPEASFNLGVLRQAAGAYDEALSWYRNVVEHRPGDAETFCRMGHCAFALGRVEDAEAFFAESLRLAPDSSSAALALANLYVAKEDLAAAEDVLRMSLAHSAADPALNYSLGLVLELGGQFRQALPHLRAVAMADGQDAGAFYHLGYCASRAGLADEAEVFLAQAVALDPARAEALFELGKHYAGQGRWKEAIGSLERCLEILQEYGPYEAEKRADPDGIGTVEVLNALGWCYERSGKRALARQAWSRSLAIEPHQNTIQEWLAALKPRPGE